MSAPSMYSLDQRQDRFEAHLERLEERIERLERLVVNVSRCIKGLWAILVPVVVAVIIKYLLH